MKKVYWGIFTLLLMALGACNNEEIKVTKTNTPEPFYTLECNVSTSSTYDPFGITDKYRTKLSNSNIYISVTTLVYNAKGNLVDSITSYVPSFTQVNQTIPSVESGEYTIMSLVTMVESDNGFKSKYWNLKDLSTLTTATIIANEYDNIDEEGVLGISENKITISGDTKTTINPKPVGALIDAKMENFDKSRFVSAGFYTKNKAYGIKLNPNLSGSERFVVNNLKENIFTSRWEQKSKNGLNNNYSGYIYIVEGGEKITWIFAAQPEGTNYFGGVTNLDATFAIKDGDLYTAGAYYTGRAFESIVGYLGSASGYTNWYSKLDKTPVTQICEEPYLLWGSSVSEVKSYMNKYDIIKDIDKPGENGNYWIAYQGKDKEFYNEYQFQNSTTGLCAVFQDLYSIDITIDEVCNYLTGIGFYLSEYNENDSIYTYYRGDTQAQIYVIRITDDEGVYKWDEYLIRFSQRTNLLYREPYLKWGASVADVKSYMKGFSLYNETPEKKGDYFGLYYMGKFKELETDYYFTSESTGLSIVNVFFDPAIVGEDEIVSSLNENEFELVLQDEESSYYLSKDAETVACFTTQSEGYYIIQYYKYKGASSRQALSRGFNVRFEKKSDNKVLKVSNKFLLNVTKISKRYIKNCYSIKK